MMCVMYIPSKAITDRVVRTDTWIQPVVQTYVTR